MSVPPPLDPDPLLIDHLEGNVRSRRGYRRHAERIREDARVQLCSIGGPGEGVYDVRLDGRLIGRVLSCWRGWEASAQPYGEGPTFRARLRRDAVGKLVSAVSVRAQ